MRRANVAVDASAALDAMAAHRARGSTAIDGRAAAQAWAALRGGRAEPTAVQTLQAKAKGSVYRLEGAGPAGTAIVAKHCPLARIEGEREVYEHVLPPLGLTVVRYHGALAEEATGWGWLFVEDAAGAAYAPGDARHRVLAGEWLGLLHRAAARLPMLWRVPDRGPEFHLRQLHAARRSILQHLAHPALCAEDVQTLLEIVRQCELLAARWSEVEAVCAAMPRTFVHGDFAPKNMRVRDGAEGPVLLPFDWGSAGAASGGVDLVQWSGRTASQWDYWANPDLDAYRAVVRGAWPRLEVPTLERAATIGKLFRSIVCVALSARSFATPWVDRAARQMRIYAAEIADALAAAGWVEEAAP